MAGNICCCGSNRTSLRVMLAINLIFAALMVIFWGAETAIYHNINAQDLESVARSSNVDVEIDSQNSGMVLGVIRGISIVALVIYVLHLLFAIFGAIGDSQNRPGFLLTWGIYLSILLAFFGVTFFLSIPAGAVPVTVLMLLLILFFGFTLKLTQYRYKEIKMQRAGALSGGGQAYIFTSVVNNDAYGGQGAVMAVDGAGAAVVPAGWVVGGQQQQQEKMKDMPPAYSDACGANPNYP